MAKEKNFVTDHRFTVRDQDGIGPHPDDMMCAIPTCGRTKAEHVPCPGALNIAGEGFQCELTPPHSGWAHQNKAAQAIWR